LQNLSFVIAFILLSNICFAPAGKTSARPAGINEPRSETFSSYQEKAAIETYGKLPLSFEANEGQFADEVKFISRGSGYNLFLTATEAVFAFDSASAEENALRMQFRGANASPRIRGAQLLSVKSNYFVGNNPEHWRAGVASYAKAICEDLYPGIDIVYYGSRQQLEYDFKVAPGANPEAIALRFQNALGARVDEQGDLLIETAAGQVRHRKPVAYQETEGGRQLIAAEYELNESGEAGFRLASYDSTRPLVIDPALAYSTYLGGNFADQGLGIAVDGAGNAYITGITTSANFPVANAFQGSPRKDSSGIPTGEVFIAKLNPAGNQLIYSTYFGGDAYEQGSAIAVDGNGAAYITGYTNSNNLPTVNAPPSTRSALAFDEDVSSRN
jgi:beta-propeller repeat-containing protein